jgi:hypothetical protein
VFRPTRETATPGDVVGVSLVVPVSLSGRWLLREPEIDRFTDALVRPCPRERANTSQAAATVYGDRTRDLVVVVTAYKPNRIPAATLNEVVAEVGAGIQRLTDLTGVDPGPLGGAATCGTAEGTPFDIAVCVWADRDSVGLVLVYHRTGEAAAAGQRDVRPLPGLVGWLPAKCGCWVSGVGSAPIRSGCWAHSVCELANIQCD